MLKIKEETCTMLSRSRTPQTQKEEQFGKCGRTTGVLTNWMRVNNIARLRKKGNTVLFCAGEISVDALPVFGDTMDPQKYPTYIHIAY